MKSVSEDQSALEGCVAVIIAANDAGRGDLSRIGKGVGFGIVADHPKAFSTRSNCQPFFLVHFSLTDTAKLGLIDKIRRSETSEIKFAPIILFIPPGPAHRAVQFIDMGFDDVLCLPEAPDVLGERMRLQFGQHIFIEAEHYLGPDRRRTEVIERDTIRRKRGGSPHDQLTIVRTPKGISILDKQRIR